MQAMAAELYAHHLLLSGSCLVSLAVGSMFHSFDLSFKLDGPRPFRVQPGLWVLNLIVSPNDGEQTVVSYLQHNTTFSREDQQDGQNYSQSESFVVLQDIEKGEELFIDYGGQYDRTSYGTSYNIRSRSVGTRRPF